MLPSRLSLALVLSVIAAALLPSLGSEFVWDDLAQIRDSPTVSSLSSIPRYFGTSVLQGATNPTAGVHAVDTYRPLFLTQMNLVWAAFGPDPRAFHANVLFWHLCVCALVWRLCSLASGAGLAAALATLWFGLHPVTTEGYLLASSVCEPMSALGLLAAVLLLESEAARRGPSGRTQGRSLLPVAAGVIYFLGLLSKETVLLALPAVSLWFVFHRRLTLLTLAPLWVAAGAALALRFLALSGMRALGQGTEQRAEALHNLPLLLADGMRALVTLQPLGLRHLSMEYDRAPLTLVLASVLLLVAVGVLAWWKRHAAPHALLALGVLAGMLAPVALVTTVDGWGGFGRYLYSPSASLAVPLPPPRALCSPRWMPQTIPATCSAASWAPTPSPKAWASGWQSTIGPRQRRSLGAGSGTTPRSAFTT